MNALLSDLVLSFRQITQRPAFALIVILTVALGIGVNSLVFSVVDGVLHGSVPFEEADRLVHVRERSEKGGTLSVAYPNYLDWRQQTQAFESLAIYGSDEHVLTGVERPEVVAALHTSPELFDVLRARPLLGRTFTAEDDELGVAKVVVLGYGPWQRLFGGSRDVLGQDLMLDGQSFEVIGVMPREFTYPLQDRRAEIWLPIRQFAGRWREDRTNRPGLQVTARLAPGVSLGAAREDLDHVTRLLQEAHTDSNRGVSVDVAVLHERLVKDVRPAMWMLSGAVGMVLLIACVNVANLLLARGAGRGHEIAVRSALGASGWQITRQLLTESLVLALAGGGLGLFLAAAGLSTLPTFLDSARFPVTTQIEIDSRVLLFTLAASLATGLVFGLFPVLQVRGRSWTLALSQGAKGSSGLERRRLRSGLVVAQTALALVLLFGSLLFLKTFHRLTHEDPGFDPQGVVKFQVQLMGSDAEQRAAFYEQLLERVRGLPGVERAATTLPLPLLGAWYSAVLLEDRPAPAPGEHVRPDTQDVSPDYFDVMGIRLVRGRFFNDADRPDSPLVAVIDETFAERHWPAGDVLGKRFKRGIDSASEEPWIEIVGVVGHVKTSGVHQESPLQYYLPASQTVPGTTWVVLETSTATDLVLPLLGDAVLEIDPNQPISDVGLVSDDVGRLVSTQRLAAALLTLFAAVAVSLAAIGIYGVLVYSVVEQRREIGIRMALGATAARILRRVMSQGMGLVACGVALGFVLAFAFTPLIANQLYGASPRDPAMLVAIVGILAAVALAACAVPARRASQVEPAEALRCE